MSQATSIRHGSIATENPYTNEVVRELPAMSNEAIDAPIGDALG